MTKGEKGSDGKSFSKNSGNEDSDIVRKGCWSLTDTGN
jgi:hypothetical protein